MQLIVR